MMRARKNSIEKGLFGHSQVTDDIQIKLLKDVSNCKQVMVSESLPGYMIIFNELLVIHFSSSFYVD